MAAQNKTTAVHFSLIFFVMLSVILGVVAYLFFADYREQSAQLRKAQDESNANQGAYQRASSEVEELKKVIGIDLPEVGVAQPGENTVLAQSTQLIQQLGSNPSAASFAVAMRDLRTELNNKTTELAQRQQEIASLQATVEALRGQYGATAAEHDRVKQEAQQDLENEQTQFTEAIAAKDREIGQLREVSANLQTELEQTKQQLGAEVARLRDQNAQLMTRNDLLRQQLDDIKGESFEVADGKIVKVDQVQRLVWINLGSDDNVRPRTTFSVYARNNTGIGRQGRDPLTGGRPDDIKGAIEVTRVLESHLAEARILDDDPARPISSGDPIYTPLWSKGRTEQFAFVGMIDIDNDGSFVGDRERLHEILQSQGAEIVSEVTDTGERLGGKIDQQTRFLVKGETPDPSTVAATDPRREQLRMMNQHEVEMENEARTNGVRIVGLNTFLDYIGFVPQQRRFIPGQTEGWNLEAGRRPSEQRPSTGNTSGIFDTNRRRPNGSSTSQRFGSGN